MERPVTTHCGHCWKPPRTTQTGGRQAFLLGQLNLTARIFLGVARSENKHMRALICAHASAQNIVTP